MRFASAVAVLVLATPAFGQEGEAEKLFRSMEKKIISAKGLKVVSEIEAKIPNAAAFKGSLLMADGNKVRMELAGQVDGKDVSLFIVSDGKTTAFKDSMGGDNAPKPTEAKQNELVQGLAARAGLFAVVFLIKGGDEKDIDKMLPVSEFKLGRKEMVGRVEALVVQYVLVADGREKLECTVWLDPRSHLPLKRRLEMTSGPEKGTFLVENYSEFVLNPRVEDRQFELPKD